MQTMANETGASRKSKGMGNNNSGEGGSSCKSNSSSGTPPDKSGLRRSLRHNLTKESVSANPSSATKSEKKEKQCPITPPATTRKSERIEKQSMVTPLRRSERGKQQSSSSPGGSKVSDKHLASPVMVKKIKKEKSVKQLNLETKMVEAERRMDARTYRAFFKASAKKLNSTGCNMQNSSQGRSDNNGGVATNDAYGRDDCNQSNGESLREDNAQGDSEKYLEASNAKESKPARTSLHDGLILDKPLQTFLHSTQKHELLVESHQPRDGDSKEYPVGDDCALLSSNRTTPMPQDDIAEWEQEAVQSRLLDPTVNKGTHESENALDSSCLVRSSKRKRDAVEMDFAATTMVVEKDIDFSNADVLTLSDGCKSNNFVDACATCCKSIRVNYNSEQREILSGNSQSNQEYCTTCMAKDRTVVEASVSMGLADQCMADLQDRDSRVDFHSDGNKNLCLICQLGGKLLYCHGKGCKRRYHLSCLDPCLKDFPLGIWHCLTCVRKMMEFGVYSVSEGVESIWDAREVEMLDDNGLRSEKQYFVKYEGLSHVHNQWVPEKQLILEACSLVEEFNQNNQVTRWKLEWSVPRCLLLKRLLMSPEQHVDSQSGHVGGILGCHYEWLVKWCGLDYEHATWELESAAFMKLPNVQSLMKDYESRRENAKGAQHVPTSGKNETRNRSSVTSSLPFIESSVDFDNDPDFAHNLYDSWQKRQSVVLDDQKRVMKVISFILSLSSCVSLPFLIITSTPSLYLWDMEFFRLAPSVYTVIYHGNNYVREGIRTLEFCEEPDRLMFQVLVTSPDTVIQDIDLLGSKKWEAVVIDECQDPVMHSHFEQFKVLRTAMRVLLVNAQHKDGITEHLSSLLDCNSNLSGDDCLVTNAAHKIGNSKERLSKYIANGSKPNSSHFTEYWIPVQLSNMQLEQYCATLIRHCHSLCSSSKTDIVGALREILISTRKCCDHPYIVDPSLQESLSKNVKDVNILDVGIKASGKLQLLDAMLSGIKGRGLRALVLFQSSGGSGKDNLGDILDDFVRQRFGQESYERIDGGVSPHTKSAALRNFNNMEGRFLFLLETRACGPAIKLSSVDTVIIFGSDWNPMNDLRNLQRVGFDSKFQQIIVFRLYSLCTVEEKVLMLSTQNKTRDSNLQNLSPATSHRLLMWGASYLFDRLAEFHSDNIQASSGDTSSVDSLLEDVVQEFLAMIPQNGKDKELKNSIILRVNQCQGSYGTSSSFLGEGKVKLMDEELPQMFWKKLLEGKRPQWKYPSGSSQRSRKRAQYLDYSSKKVEDRGDEIVKKRKKVTNNNVAPPSLKPASIGAIGPQEHNILQQQPSAGGPLGTVHTDNSSISQNILHIRLKPEMEKLCEVLQLPDDLKGMVERILDYVMNYRDVNSESATTLQAFQISACWIAASLMKHKLDHKESLARAKQHLNFGCKKEEADIIYSLLMCLKKKFLHHSGYIEMNCSSETVHLSTEVLGNGDQVLSQLGLAQEDFAKSTSYIVKKSDRRNNKLLQKHQQQKEDFNRKYELEKAQLELKKRTEAAVIRLHRIGSARTDKLRLLDVKYEQKFAELKCQMEMNFKSLVGLQLAAVNKLQEKKANWIQKVKSWAQIELTNELSIKEDGNYQEKCISSSGELVPQQSQSMRDENVLLKVSEAAGSNEARQHIVPRLSSMSEQVIAGAIAEEAPIVERQTVSLGDGLEAVASASSPLCQHQITDVEITLEEIVGFRGHDSIENNARGSLSKERATDEAALMLPDGEFQIGMPGIAQSSSGLESTVSLNLQSKEQAPVRSSSDMQCIEPLVELPESASLEAMKDDGTHSESNRVRDGTDIEADHQEREVLSGNHCSHSLDKAAVGKLQAVSETTETTPIDMGENGNVLVCETTSSHSSQSLDRGSLDKQQNRSVTLEVPETALGEITRGGENGELPVRMVQVDKNVESVAVSVEVSCAEGDQQDECTPAQICKPASAETMDAENALGGINRVSDLASDDDSGSALQSNQLLEPSLASQADSLVPATGDQNDLQRADSSTMHLGDGASDQTNQSHNDASTQNMQHLLAPSADSSVDAMILASASGVEPWATLLTENYPELSNQPAVDPVVSLQHFPTEVPASGLEAHVLDRRSISSGISNLPVQMPSHMGPDPLQNEMERIQKEKDQTIVIHEDTKLRLKSDCEKEIEQIRRKYESKLNDLESQYVAKIKELEQNHNKVLMNQILAQAFRSKCRSSTAPGRQQEMTSGLMQLLRRPSSQPTAQRPIVADWSSSLQTTTTPVAPPVAAQSSAASGALTRPPRINSFLPAASLQTTTTPVAPPVAGQSSAASGTVTRPPHINSFLPATSLQTTTTPVAPPVAAQSSAVSGTVTRPPNINSVLPTSSLQTTTTPVPVTRPPHINSVLPTSSLQTTTTPVPVTRPPHINSVLPTSSLQPTTTPVPVTRPPHINSVLPTSSLQTTTTPGARLVAAQATAASGTHTRPPHISSVLPASSMQTTKTAVAPLVAAQNTAPSGMPTRPPHINTFLPSTSNLQVGSEFRAPPPHLQRFRTSPPVPSTGLSPLPRGMPSHMIPGNFPRAPSFPQHPSRPPSCAPQPGPHSRAGHLDTAGPLPPVSRDQAGHLDTGGQLPPVSNTSRADDLTVDVEKLASINPVLSSLTPVTDVGSNSDRQVQPELVPSTSTANTLQSEVVCLSDDD